ncbi:MAG: hypothetical protein IPG54_12270 [Sphingomonadales bacterium]|jgi:hypothetical protein|nr:hypothetical protein [Sphingomonadales bacterium]MBK9004460.1 hypothetical protein [Sphingomonadales bacterium]MBK9269646.1 hypothetical protein [Sphingomonadales bacterium]
MGIKRILAIAAAAIFAASSNATPTQLKVPAPKSTDEYKQASIRAVPFSSAEQIPFWLIACDKNDAAGCSQIAQLNSDDFNLVIATRPGATQLAFGEKAIALLRRSCTELGENVEGACAYYHTFLSDAQFIRLSGYDAHILDGGRLLAKRCLAGLSDVESCEHVESLIEKASQAERDALAAYVDKGFATGCEQRNAYLCMRSLFVIRYGNEKDRLRYPIARIDTRIRQIASACEAGHPNICTQLGVAVAEMYGKELYAYSAATFAIACRLPPVEGEENVQQKACIAEKELRDLIAKGN